MIVVVDEIIQSARAAGRGVCAFNVVSLEHAEAIVAGAETARAAVVLQISENCVAYHGALAPIARACLAVASQATVPVSVHLDHASSVKLVEAAAELGLTSVMYDASGLPYQNNVRSTAEVARWCHERGIWVEAELGEIGGKDGVHSPAARTDPGEAARFVSATAVDALAIAVGSSHAMLTRDAVLDLGLIAAIRHAVSVPLVLHGSSGVPDRDLVAAVRAGMTKVNIATQLNRLFTAAVRRTLSDGRPRLILGGTGQRDATRSRRRWPGCSACWAPGMFPRKRMPGRANRRLVRAHSFVRTHGQEALVSRYRRWNDLLELLAAAGQLQIEDAAKALNVSAATIRRDFDELANQQMLTRIRGGAVAQAVNYDLPLRYKSERHPSEKQRIGGLAAGLVRAGQIVGLNGGTTTTEVARALATRGDLSHGGAEPAATVVTNALNIATELAVRQHIKIVTTGGVARPQSYELTGPLATCVLERVALDLAILGVDGIDAVAGATAHHEGEASINQLMARQARKVIIVADSSKVGRRAFARICGLADIDVLVTDTGIAHDDMVVLQEAGVDVVTA